MYHHQTFSLHSVSVGDQQFSDITYIVHVENGEIDGEEAEGDISQEGNMQHSLSLTVVRALL